LNESVSTQIPSVDEVDKTFYHYHIDSFKIPSRFSTLEEITEHIHYWESLDENKRKLAINSFVKCLQERKEELSILYGTLNENDLIYEKAPKSKTPTKAKTPKVKTTVVPTETETVSRTRSKHAAMVTKKSDVLEKEVKKVTSSQSSTGAGGKPADEGAGAGSPSKSKRGRKRKSAVSAGEAIATESG